MCNCAKCKRDLLGESMAEVSLEYLRNLFGSGSVPWRVAKRIDGRPYCKWCKDQPQRVKPIPYPYKVCVA